MNKSIFFIFLVFELLFFASFKSAKTNEFYYQNSKKINNEKDTINPKKELLYSVRGRYNRPATKTVLEKAKLISDIIPNYPVNWIKDYSSVEFTSTCNGVKTTAFGISNTLSKEQVKLLNTIDVGAGLDIIVKYKTINGITNKTEHNEMNVMMMIVPEIEASYKGGYEELIAYLQENSLYKIDSSLVEDLKQLSIYFTISEQGKSENAEIKMTSGNTTIDNLMLQLIKEMPQWNAAKDLNGNLIIQDFEFTFGKLGC